jgi:hypothetical protein
MNNTLAGCQRLFDWLFITSVDIVQPLAHQLPAFEEVARKVHPKIDIPLHVLFPERIVRGRRCVLVDHVISSR